ncbi:addiction module toxin RelE [Salmonella enterica subsp. salamae]|uniref:Toxin RelE n=1 Tax=Salmonella enterica TaxID=28901 RepID=A0A379SCN8_SALER|nr:addiction module toxin RelE [Salmonella enterica subsp. salamae serovar Sofia]EBI4370906.1 addiction module toxin RelE [Salmonella enterica]ECC9150715.1 addiction module toxin RelE [Salmonella enterica subsp. salamae]HAC6503835.1 addiction module toxin RelE [Salmonella enterica subsp. salamae serovar 30:1,z28:z6]EBS3813819.1 addiction module toxin RelE [Salmonella enterica subsp. salamae serovar Sofia]
MKAAAKTLYAKAFIVPQGGKRTSPRELTQVSDRGECAQATQRQLEG